jgi:LPXTG-site transpeptidase (sortase) family protein
VIRKTVIAVLGLALLAVVGLELTRTPEQQRPRPRFAVHATSRSTPRIPAAHAAATASNRRELRIRLREAKKNELSVRLRSEATAFSRSLRDGQPLGRIVIPRIHLRSVVVEGTTESDLAKGLGHYNTDSGLGTALPGMGGVIAIAGHRTTHLAPFRHIDNLRSGDNIYLRTAYGTFRYTVYAHRTVAPDEWSILRSRPFEKLVLSACHPLYSASHRWIVFARLRGETDRIRKSRPWTDSRP